MEYFKNYLQGLGVATIHISLDMQLYMAAMWVKWSDIERWRATVPHPGGMHNLMSFFACIEKLLKGSVYENLLLAAYNGFAGIKSGTRWTVAIH